MTKPLHYHDDGTLPQWLTKKLDHQRKQDHKLHIKSDYHAVVEDNRLTMWEAKYPELKMRLTLTGNAQNDAGAYDFSFGGFKTDLAEHQATLRQLEQTYHYQVKRNPPDSPLQLILQQRGGEPFTHEVSNQSGLKEFLQNAKSIAMQKQFARAFDSDEVAQAEVKSSDLAGRFAEALSNPDAFISRHGAGHNNAGTGKPPRANRPSIAEDQKVTLIISDENVIKNLASPRNFKDRTWLDILPAASSQIIIPSYVADVKMLRRSIYKAADGAYKFEHFDKDSNETAAERAWKELADKATRRHFTVTNGKLSYVDVVGEEPNIIIYDTPSDHQLTASIRAAKNGKEVIRELEHAASNVAGDMIGMTYAASTESIAGPVYVISNNFKWHADRQLSKPVTTKAGKPIGHATLSGYLVAELSTSAAAISEDLASRGTPVHGEITLARIRRNIAEASGMDNNEFSKNDVTVIVPGKIRQAGGSHIQGELLGDLFRGVYPQAAAREAEVARLAQEALHRSLRAPAQQAHRPVMPPLEVPPAQDTQDIFSHAYVQAPALEAGANAPTVPPPTQTLKRSPQLMATQRQMRTLFTKPDGNEYTAQEIINAVPKEYIPLTETDIALVFGRDIAETQTLDIAILRTAGAKMYLALDELTHSRKKLAEFERLHEKSFLKQIIAEQQQEKTAPKNGRG